MFSRLFWDSQRHIVARHHGLYISVMICFCYAEAAVLCWALFSLLCASHLITQYQEMGPTAYTFLRLLCVHYRWDQSYHFHCTDLPREDIWEVTPLFEGVFLSQDNKPMGCVHECYVWAKWSTGETYVCDLITLWSTSYMAYYTTFLISPNLKKKKKRFIMQSIKLHLWIWDSAWSSCMSGSNMHT